MEDSLRQKVFKALINNHNLESRDFLMKIQIRKYDNEIFEFVSDVEQH